MKKIILITILIAQFFNVLAQNWLPTGNGTNNGSNGGIELQTYNGKLIAGGAFSQAGTANANGVAMWDGTNWSIVDSTMNNFFAVRPLIIFNGSLYGFVSPIFNTPGYMIRLDSNFKWHIVPNSNCTYQTQTGSIFSACVYNNELYVGGSFDTIGNINASYIAKWDGSTWAPVGAGVNNEDVNGLKVYNNELYVGGAFTQAGGVVVNHLAKWNGNTWSDVGGGISGGSYWAFRAMEVYNNELYIGGDLEYAGGLPMVHITKWNGSMFSDVGGGLGFAGSPDALKVFGNRLVLGGYFGAGLFHNMAGTWDGIKFDSLGTGLNTGPTGFEIYNCQLYAGGRFNGISIPNGVAVLDTLNCTTGIVEINLPEYSASVYPNPFSNSVNINVNGNYPSQIILCDILSRKLLQQEFTNSISLNTSQLASGIYFYQLKNKNGTFNEGKIIKE